MNPVMVITTTSNRRQLYDMFRDLPAFIALEQEMDAYIADEHDEVLQLICFNNPVPDEWQPLPETCEGVVERPSR